MLTLGALACDPPAVVPEAGQLDARQVTAPDAHAEDARVEDAQPEDASQALDANTSLDDRVAYLESCQALPHDCAARDLGPRCGQCQYRTMIDTTQCTRESPCDRLFLLWAAMDCASEEAGNTMRAVASRPGWVAACAQPLFPGEMLPTTLGAPARDNDTVSAIFNALRTSGVWTGQDLLMGGCSAGATRYPVVAARTPDDTGWLASRTNAACFSEGVFDLATQDRITGEGAATGATSCGFRHQRIITGFTSATARPGHGCEASPGAQCACDPLHATRSWPGSCGSGDCLSYESIVSPSGSFASGITGADFAIPNWKLVSEGNDFAATPDRCVRDVVPEAPIASLCQRIDEDPTRTCTLDRFPAAAHCSTYWRNLSTGCLSWFEAL
jgi:hypothetical protein